MSVCERGGRGGNVGCRRVFKENGRNKRGRIRGDSLAGIVRHRDEDNRKMPRKNASVLVVIFM